MDHRNLKAVDFEPPHKEGGDMRSARIWDVRRKTSHETFMDGLSHYQQYVFDNPVEVEEVMQ